MRFILAFLFLCIFLAKSRASSSLVPALYVFGDSLVDAGNNNEENRSIAKANFLPYGIDYPTGPTGRFTNGKTIADIIADLLGIPTPPRIMGFDTNKVQTSGFNYGSGCAGILDDSGFVACGYTLNMKTQVKLLKETVENYLPKHFKSEQKLAKYLSKSIFLMTIGSADFSLNYFDSTNYNTSSVFSPTSFATYLLNALEVHLKEMYKIGARKFVVFDVGPYGCLPSYVENANITTRCAEDVNDVVKIYDSMLGNKLDNLSSKLKGSTFVAGLTYSVYYDPIINPTRYGFVSDTLSSCCSYCFPNTVPCKDRNKYVYWDRDHPTEAASRIVANKCFTDASVCSPISVKELALKV